MVEAESQLPALSHPPAPPTRHRTFRDPAGSVEITPEGVFRTVLPPYDAGILEFLATPLAGRLVREGKLVDSQVVSHEPGGPLVLSHPRITFPSYPWEWSPQLWLRAAELTLNLCSDLVKEGWILKDATPLNVLFEGTRPVFVDVLSIERLDPDKPLWYAYGQFVRTFVLPMLALSQLGWPLHAIMMRRDGFEPEDIYAALPWYRSFRSPAFSAVTLPTLLSKTSIGKAGSASTGKPAARDPEITRHIIGKTVNRLHRVMRQAMPARRASAWASYVETGLHYSDEDHAGKRAFVQEALTRAQPRRVLDVGCNTGVYSRLAAATGAEVISIDSDLQALDRLCAQIGPPVSDNKTSAQPSAVSQTAAPSSAQPSAYVQPRAEVVPNILPLAIDFAHSTPATGWESLETPSFLQRAEGYFDTVLMLAVIHHLLLSSQVPLDRIASVASRITTRNLIIEWPQPSDPKFVEVLRGREALYTHLNETNFRAAFARYFDTAQETTLANGRILLHLIKK